MSAAVSAAVIQAGTAFMERFSRSVNELMREAEMTKGLWQKDDPDRPFTVEFGRVKVHTTVSLVERSMSDHFTFEVTSTAVVLLRYLIAKIRDDKGIKVNWLDCQQRKVRLTIDRGFRRISNDTSPLPRLDLNAILADLVTGSQK